MTAASKILGTVNPGSEDAPLIEAAPRLFNL